MQLKEEAIFTLKFDGKPVINQLGELEQRLSDVKEAQKSVEKGTKEWAENKAEIKQLEASIKAVREEMGVSGMTVRQLEGYFRQLNQEIKNLTPGTEAYKQKMGDLQEVNGALSAHRQNIRGVGEEASQTQGIWSNVKTWIASAFTVTAILEAGRAIVNFALDSVKEFRAFESAAQDLSAVTGATGKDLEYLKEQAEEVGPTFGKTGAEMLEAYKLMASAKPELLAQKELLAETTKAALTLADAGKIDLATATKVTAESLNQFGEAADQANRFINVIAAGAKEGSAEINEMGGSLKASGTVAKAANLSFEQTNAVLQSMSTIALKGEQAGTMLRNVLLKLQSGANDTNPAIVGLDTALENVAKKSYTAADMAKIFGAENVVAAQHIVAHRKEIGELTTKLTGTQEAFKQAAANSATLDKEIDKAKATISNMSIGLVSAFVPAITKGIQGVVGFVNIIRSVPEFVEENSTTLAALGVALVTFNGQMIAAEANTLRKAAADKIAIVWTEASTVATRLWTAALAMNPIGLVVTAIALLVAGFTAAYNHSETFRAGIAGLWQGMQMAIQVAYQFTKALLSMDIKSMADIMANGGSRVGAAFNKGYEDKLAEGRPKQIADHKKTIDTKVDLDLKGAQTIGTNSVLEQEKANQKKAAEAERHRQAELKKAQEAAQKEAEEKIKADNETLKKVEEMRIASIKNDLEREIAHIRAKRDLDVEANMASKASSDAKAQYETERNAQMIREVADAEEKARVKKEKEDAETGKRILDLKIKLSGDEKADKLQKLDDVAAATRLQIAKDITDDTQKATMLKQVNDNLIRDKEKVEAEYRRKKEQDDAALQDTLYRATVADANNRLLLAGTNAKAIYEAKKAMLDAEYEHNKAKLQREAAEEKARNNDSITDSDRRAQANKAIDDRLVADLSANHTKYENDKTALTAEKNEARRQNTQQFFEAIKGLMDGDFKTFTDLLEKKLLGEKKQLTEKQQKNIDTIDAIGEYTVMATQALQKLSQLKLDKELANIKKEKDSQLASWKEKYDKGLINKETYEKEVDNINKDADAKTKQAQLDAFRRQQKLDIAMAVINGAQAALKSLATMGWPLGLFGVAGAAIATGIQIALIKRQEPPSLAKGGYVRNAGIPDGPNHGRNYGDSGIALVRRDTNEEVGEMEGKEPILILSQNTYKNNNKVIDSLLHSSLHRNGAPIMKRGGIFGSDGGSYGDYLQKGGLRRFDNGGWMDEINNNDDGGGNSGGSSGDSSSDAGSSSSVDASLQGQIDESQKTMEGIAKNTADTVEVLGKVIATLETVNTSLGNLQVQVRSATDDQQYAIVNAVKALDYTVRSGMLDQTISQNAQLNVLGSGLQQELAALNLATKNGLDMVNANMLLDGFALRLLLLNSLSNLQTAMHQDSASLEKSLHTDLADLMSLTHAEFTDLQKSVHSDLDVLSKSLTLSNTTLEKTLTVEFDAMRTATAKQQSDLLVETKLNFTTLQTILKDELTALSEATHADLMAVLGSNKEELQLVQGMLNAGNGEQNYQSTLLRIIADKSLSVSVQSFVSVWNAIQVVVNASDFK